MPNEEYNFLGAMQTSSVIRSRKVSTDHIPSRSNHFQQAPSCLELSPSNSLRSFAISFLGHWIYPFVIVVTICAFVISSASFYILDRDQNKVEAFGNFYEDSSSLFWTRRALCLIILLEIVIKCLARGIIVGIQSYLRRIWDLLDVLSFIAISFLTFLGVTGFCIMLHRFISIIVPRKAVGTLAAGVVILKLVPIHTGLINAFNSLCSCAKKLIPTLIYAIIIVWIYAVVIFTLFIKPLQQDVSVNLSHDHFAKTNSSTSDSFENENTTKESHFAGFVDQGYLTPSTSKQFQNFSFGLSVECMPTNLRSLSGSFIVLSQMLLLGFSPHILLESSGNASSLLTEFVSTCQYELYILLAIDTLVIVTGTLPIVTITFGTLFNHFQTRSLKVSHHQLNHHRYDTENEQDSQSSYQYHHQQRRSLGSGISGRSINSHTQNYSDEGSSSVSTCLNGFFGKVANILCDCDYYFCFLASLQRRLNPFTSRLLNSKKYKIFIMLIVSVDFVCMMSLLWCFTGSNHTSAEYSLSWTLKSCVQMCFVIYTVEATLKWFALSSEEYWRTVWAAFDFTVVLVYWIGFAVIYVKSLESLYLQFTGIMMIRMFRVCQYWITLEFSLKASSLTLHRNCDYYIVVSICTWAIFLIKNAVSEYTWSDGFYYLIIDNSSNAFFPALLANMLSLAALVYLWCFMVVCVTTEVQIAYKQIRDKPPNKRISVLLNDSQSDELVNTNYPSNPRRSLPEASSPLSIMSYSNGISPSKFSFGTVPSDNGLLTQETQSSILSPTSDILSPLLSLPTSRNELNGHVQSSAYDRIDDVSHRFAKMNRLEETRTQEKCSTEIALDYLTALLIIVSTLNIVYKSDSDDDDMNWLTVLPKKSLWIEVLFVVGVMLHIVYRTRLCKFSRESFLQAACFYDLLMTLSALMEIFGSGTKWFPVRAAPKGVKMIAECAKIISACRGLMLISRLAWLRNAGKLIFEVFRQSVSIFAGLIYVIFISMISWSEIQKMIVQISEAKYTNETTLVNASFSGDYHSKDSFRCSFVLLICTLILIVFTFSGFLGALLYKLHSWNDVFMLFGCSLTSAEPSKRLEEHYAASFQAMNQPSKGICVPVLFYVTNHHKFDIVVMLIVILDGLGITFEYFATSERALILRKHYPAYIVFLYTIELTTKLAGNGKKFFKSKWNTFDFILILTTYTGFFLNLVLNGSRIAIFLLNMRFFRILRILQFHLFAQYAQPVHNFFYTVPTLIVPIRNLATFYFCVFLSVVTFKLRCYQFIPSKDAIEWIATPFQVFSIQAMYQTIGSLHITHFTVEFLYVWCSIMFSFVRGATIFSIWVFLVASICRTGPEKRPTTPHQGSTMITPIPYRFHEDHVPASSEFNDKFPYLIPCVSPETIDLVETPSTSGANYRRHSSASGVGVMPVQEEAKSSNRNSPLNTNKLYKTTTITSSEEINGCQVFFVEAMITTV